MSNGKTALVLSAGGMFGAYQAGAWQALSEFFQPDIVVGASIGSLNGWVIASGCDPALWAKSWRLLDEASRQRIRFPRSPREGIWDPRPFEGWVRELYFAHTPRVPFGVVMTELLRLRPRLICTPDVTWRHLAASCAVPGVLPLPKIEGRTYADGGVLGVLPLWAAAQMGAERIVAINVLAQPPLAFGVAIRTLRSIAPRPSALPAGLQVVTISPCQPLGNLKDSLYWRREKAEIWISEGYRDALNKRMTIEEMLAGPVPK